MKIGILIDSLDKIGGIGKIAISEVIELQKIGIDAELLVFNNSNINKYELENIKINVNFLEDVIDKNLRLNIKIPGFTILNISHFLYPFIYILKTKSKQWDIIICHESYLMPYAILLKLFKNIKIIYYNWDPVLYIYNRVYSLHHSKIKKLIYNCIYFNLDRLFIKFSNIVLTGGRSHYAYLNEFAPNKTHILYPGVEPKKISSSKKEMSIFIVTAWKNGKNPEYILEIANKLPMYKFKIGGMWLDDDYLNNFIKYVNEKSKFNNVIILGSLTELELIENYSNSHVVLQTNDDRGFGMPAYEAAACSTTFVIPKGQGVCDLFIDEIHGFFVEEFHTEEIVMRLEFLYNNPNRAVEMGQSAFNLIKTKYSNYMHGKNLLEIIDATI